MVLPQEDVVEKSNSDLIAYVREQVAVGEVCKEGSDELCRRLERLTNIILLAVQECKKDG